MKMKKIYFSLAVFIGLSGIAGELTIPEEFWRAPAGEERFATLSAGWNSDKADADFALSMPLAGGYGIRTGVPGAIGKGIEIIQNGGYLHFRGDNNLNPDLATIRFMAKGKAWGKEQEMTLFSARRETYSIEIVRYRDRLALVVRRFAHMRNKKDQKMLKDGKDWRSIDEVAIPLPQDMSENRWYSVVVGWDSNAASGFIALDGKGQTGKLTFPKDQRGILIVMIGSAAHTKNNPNALGLAGTAFDELQFYNQRLSDLLKWSKNSPPEELLRTAEKGAHNYFRTILDLQRTGGWQNVYSWPTLMGSDAQGRSLIQYDDIVSNDKSRGSALIASWLIYGYELFNNHHYLDAARKCADFFLQAQTPEGAWNYLYKISINNITHAELPEFKFQDSAQSHPLYLMGHMYRITGEKKYYDAMLKSGEFYLAAQNPDGSWSHHYSVERKRGETARSQPQGGEINDLAMNDAVDVMVLMYHFTKDRKYIDAVKRAGEWLLKAQLKGTVNGWAQQYDNQLQPTWARKFEAPSMSRTATDDACRVLAELYRLSGDERYRNAIAECRDWFMKKFPEKKMYDYYDHHTGRPIAAHMDKIYFMDDEKEYAEFISFFRGRKPKSDWAAPNFDAILASAIYPVNEQKPSKEDLPKMMQLTRSLGKMAVESQNEAGVWVYPCYANSIDSIGAGFIPGQGRMMMLLRYIDVAKTMRGELPLKFRGGVYPHGPGNNRNLAWPENWYNIPWNQSQ